jgi:sialic acid synthase
MVRDLRRCREAMGDGVKRVYETEVAPITKMGKKIVAARDLPAGHVLQPEDIVFKSPGDGLPPYELDKVVGRTTLCELKPDDNLSFEVLGGDATSPWLCPEVLDFSGAAGRGCPVRSEKNLII